MNQRKSNGNTRTIRNRLQRKKVHLEKKPHPDQEKILRVGEVQRAEKWKQQQALRLEWRQERERQEHERSQKEAMENTAILFVLIREEKYKDAIQIVKNRQIMINTLDETGNAPLHIIASQCDLRRKKDEEGDYYWTKNYKLMELIDQLFHTGTLQVDAKNQAGQTALHIAAEKDNRHTVFLLLEIGASIYVRTNDGLSISDLTNDRTILDKIYSLLRSELYWGCRENNVEKINQSCQLAMTFRLSNRLRASDRLSGDAWILGEGKNSWQVAVALGKSGIQWEGWGNLDLKRAPAIKQRWQEILAEDKYFTKRIDEMIESATQMFAGPRSVVTAYLQDDLPIPLMNPWDIDLIKKSSGNTIMIRFNNPHGFKFVFEDKEHPLNNLIRKMGAVEKRESRCCGRFFNRLLGQGEIEFTHEDKDQCKQLYNAIEPLAACAAPKI